MQTITRLVCVVFILCGLGVGELGARPRTFVAGQGVRMKTEVPPGYSFKSESVENGQVIVKMENPVWPILIVVAIARESDMPSRTDEAQRNLLVTQTAEILAQSKEQDYKFVPLQPASGSGVYCVFTEPSTTRAEDLEPGSFLHIVAGIKVVRGAVMHFRIHANDLTTPEYQEAFDLFINGFDEA